MLQRLSGILFSTACVVVPCRAQCDAEALLPWDSGPKAVFGLAIDRDGPVAVAGSGVLTNRGQVYVLEQLQGVWTDRQILEDSDGLSYAWGSTFGSDVAVWADWIAVSEPTQSVDGLRATGCVHLYRRSDERWEFVDSIIAGDAHDFERFGSRVAMANGVLAVAAEGDWTPASGMYSWGSVYVFELAHGAWGEVAKLSWTGNPDSHDGEFGAALEVDGNRVLVGTGGHGYFGEGARIFNRSSGSWKLEQIIKLPLGFTSGLGASVDLRGDRLAVGASPFDANVSGAAFVYDKIGPSWKQVAAVKPTDTDVWHSYFGYSVALVEDGLAVGSHGTDNGAVYLFREIEGTWGQVHRLDGPAGYRSNEFGFALAVQGDSMLISASHSYIAPGGARGVVFDLSAPLHAVQFCTCPVAPCGVSSKTGGCGNSSGSSGVLTACGSGSVQADDAVLRANGLPPGARTIFFMGASTNPKPFGAGVLCVTNPGGERFAFPVAVADQAGMAQVGPGIVETASTSFGAAGQIQSGDTWSFQAWYLDPANPCGSGVNLTNGLRVQFAP